MNISNNCNVRSGAGVGDDISIRKLVEVYVNIIVVVMVMLVVMVKVIALAMVVEVTVLVQDSIGLANKFIQFFHVRWL